MNTGRSKCWPVKQLAFFSDPAIFGRDFGSKIPHKSMSDDREDVFSKAVRAGKRTYFFDVKSTRARDLFLTITESKKHTHPDGSTTYDKHKIFLYKEDFDKFLDGLHDAFDEIDRLRATGQHHVAQDDGPSSGTSDDTEPYTGINFEDLDRKDI
jgi:hypothetical protein